MEFLRNYFADTERVYNNALARTLESTDGFTSTLVLYQPSQTQSGLSQSGLSLLHGLLNEAYTLVLNLRRTFARAFGLMA